MDSANAFLTHLAGRGFSAATVRAYAFDVANLARFLTERDVTLSEVQAPLVFDWIDWQGVRRTGRPQPGSAAAYPGLPAGRAFMTLATSLTTAMLSIACTSGC